MDLTTIPDSVLLARGKYSTVRAEHEDAKKQLQILCGRLSSIGSQILRQAQPSGEQELHSGDVAEQIMAGRVALDEIQACIANIEQLQAQRKALKPEAWGRN